MNALTMSGRTTAAACVTLFFIFILALVPAQASTYDDFVGFLEKLEDEAEKAGTPVTVEQMGFPASTEQMRDAEGLVNCLEEADNDYEVGNCVDRFSDSDLGKKIVDEGEVPSEVGMFIDCYILYGAHDYWGLAWKLSNVAACLVVHVLTGGVDICGLLQDIYDLATDIYDYAKVIIEWLGDAGEAIVNVIEDVACTLDLGGCDDKPKTPPYLVILKQLHPFLSDGLTEKEKVAMDSYAVFLDNLKKNVLDSMNRKIEKFNEEAPHGFSLPLYTQNQMEQAATIFTHDVNIAWTSDIQHREIQRRNGLVDLYFKVNKAELASMVIDQCAADASCSAQNIISQRCEFDISFGLAFRHIDHWKKLIDSDIQGLAGQQQGVASNYQVCESNYGLQKKELIAVVADYLQQQNLCKENQDKYECSGIEGYTQCTNIFHAFEKDGVCQYNAAELAKEAKLKIMARFREMGSSFYAPKQNLQQNNQTMNMKGLTNKKKGLDFFTPTPFPCYRPTHTYYFNQVYQELYGNVPTQLLTAEEQYSDEYEQLRASTQHIVSQLKQKPELATCSFTISPIDPLVVETSSNFCVSDVQEAGLAPEFTFKVSPPGLPIDGQSEPVLFYDLSGLIESRLKNPPKQMTSREDLAGPITVDPLTELQNKQALRVSDSLGSIQKGKAKVGIQQVGTLKNIGAGTFNAPAAGKKVMSGQVPEGSKLPGSSVAGMQLQQSPARLEAMPISSMHRVGRPVEIKVKNEKPEQIDFILEHQPASGPFKTVVRPSVKMRQEGDLVLLSLDLDEPGQYRIRFRQKNSGPWGAWSNFKLAGDPRQMSQSASTSRKINPQPEPPGKPQIGQAQPIRLQPPQIISPRNGEHFRMRGSSIAVTVEVDHGAKEKPDFEFQIKEQNRFIEVKPRLQLRQGGQHSTAVLTLKRSGEYRVRAGSAAGKWSGWQGFIVDQLDIQKPSIRQPVSKDKGGGPVAPLPIRPRIQ